MTTISYRNEGTELLRGCCNKKFLIATAPILDLQETGMNRKKQKENFNDLLIPILLVLCVMPFIIHLAEYSCGYSKYLWYAENDTIQDLYCYYRSYFFEVIAVITLAVLVFRMGLYKENRKPWRMFVPLGLYAVMTVVSTGFSVNVTASTSGNSHIPVPLWSHCS